MKDFMQSMLRNKMITAVVSIVFGIVLIVGQSGAVAEIIRILGILLLIAAIVGLLAYFLSKDNRKNPTTLTLSILGLVAALIFIYSPGWLIAIFPIVMGVILIVNGVANISGLVSSPARGGAFTAALILAIVTVVLGVIAVIHPTAIADTLILFIGVTYLCNGVSDLVALGALK